MQKVSRMGEQRLLIGTFGEKSEAVIKNGSVAARRR
jgi:hypothetical protein